MIGDAIYKLLSTHTALTTVCPQISVLRTLENISAPFLIYSIDNIAGLQTKDSASPLDDVTLDISI